MARASIYEFAGGEQAFLALAAATHERCLADPELNHPFSHHVSPGHIEHLAAYWAEVFGGPRRYSESLGGHSGMLSIHAGEDAPDEMGDRFATLSSPATPSSARRCGTTCTGPRVRSTPIRRREPR